MSQVSNKENVDLVCTIYVKHIDQQNTPTKQKLSEITETIERLSTDCQDEEYKVMYSPRPVFTRTKSILSMTPIVEAEQLASKAKIQPIPLSFDEPTQTEEKEEFYDSDEEEGEVDEDRQSMGGCIVTPPLTPVQGYGNPFEGVDLTSMTLRKVQNMDEAEIIALIMAQTRTIIETTEDAAAWRNRAQSLGARMTPIESHNAVQAREIQTLANLLRGLKINFEETLLKLKESEQIRVIQDTKMKESQARFKKNVVAYQSLKKSYDTLQEQNTVLEKKFEDLANQPAPSEVVVSDQTQTKMETLMIRVEALRGHNEQLKDHIRRLEEQLSQKDVEIHELQEEKKEVDTVHQQRLSEMEMQMFELQNSVDDAKLEAVQNYVEKEIILEDENKRLKDEAAINFQRAEHMKIELGALKHVNEETSKKMEVTKQALQTADRNMEELSNRLMEQESVNATLENDMRLLYASHKKDLQTLNEQYKHDDYKSKYQGLMLQNDELQYNINTLIAQYSGQELKADGELQSMVDKFAVQLGQYKRAIAVGGQWRQRVQSLTSSLKQVKEELMQSQLMAQTLDAQLNQSQESSRDWEAKYHNSTTEVAELKSEHIQELEKMKEEYEGQAGVLEQKLMVLELECNNLKEELTTSTLQYEETQASLQADHDQLASDMKQSVATLRGELDQLGARYEAASQEVLQFRETVIPDMNSQLESSANMIAFLQQENEVRSAALADTEKQLTLAQEKGQASSAQVSEMELALARKTEEAAEVRKFCYNQTVSLEMMYGRLLATQHDAAEQVLALEAQISDSAAKHADLLARFAETQNTLLAAQSEVTQETKARQESDLGFQSRLESLTLEKESLARNLDDEVEKLQALQTRMDDLKQELALNQEATASLREELLVKQDECESKQVELTDIEALVDELVAAQTEMLSSLGSEPQVVEEGELLYDRVEQAVAQSKTLHSHHKLVLETCTEQSKEVERLQAEEQARLTELQNVHTQLLEVQEKFHKSELAIDEAERKSVELSGLVDYFETQSKDAQAKHLASQNELKQSMQVCSQLEVTVADHLKQVKELETRHGEMEKELQILAQRPPVIQSVMEVCTKCTEVESLRTQLEDLNRWLEERKQTHAVQWAESLAEIDYLTNKNAELEEMVEQLLDQEVELNHTVENAKLAYRHVVLQLESLLECKERGLDQQPEVSHKEFLSLRRKLATAHVKLEQYEQDAVHLKEALATARAQIHAKEDAAKFAAMTSQRKLWRIEEGGSKRSSRKLNKIPVTE